MKRIGVLFAALIMITSCAKQELAESEIVIEGNVKSIPDGKVYLADAHTWQTLLDSAEVKDGYFVFKFRPDSAFVPRMAAIQYPYEAWADSVDRFTMHLGYKRIRFRNHMKGADSLRNYNEAFFLERGHTRMVGDNKGKGKVRIFAGRETDTMFRNMKADFGWLGNTEGAMRQARIESFSKEINKNPYSYYLMGKLYIAKEQYSKGELRQILTLFDKDVLESREGQKINDYLANRADPNKPYTNFSLSKPDKQQGWIMDNAYKVNMLVFWASWCGPCRKEIPQLKEIHQEYKEKGLNMVSISIDKSEVAWHKALEQEKMEWQQLIADEEQSARIMQHFNFSSIPLVVITDSKGKEIKRFIGYEKDQEELYRAVIKEHLEPKLASIQ